MDLDIFKSDTQSFIKELGGPNQAKVAEAAGLYIAEKLRERSFARQILTPRVVNRYDLKNSTEHDQLVFIDEKEVNVSAAKVMNFKGEPDAVYINTPRYEIPIFEVASPWYEKKEIELLASTQPVTKIIEENTVKEIEETEDTTFLRYTAAAAVASGNTLQIDQGAAVTERFTKTALKRLINLIERNRLKCSTVLMSVTKFNDLLDGEFAEYGSELLREITVDGYTYYKLGGRRVIVSIKRELFLDPSITLADGVTPAERIYGFADEKALGRFLILESTKFMAEKRRNIIGFGALEYIGMAIANTKAVSYVVQTNR